MNDRRKEDLRQWWSPRNTRDFDEVTHGSRYLAIWVCPAKDHEFSRSVSYMYSTKAPQWCPLCSGKLPIPGETDLLTKDPELSLQVSPNNQHTPAEISYYSTQKILWRCKDHGHEYIARLDKRIKSNYGCPYCSGQSVLRGFNDLQSTYPHLAEEWSDNNQISPYEVTYGSSAQKYLWECRTNRSHVWEATPNTRTNGETGSGCPVCSNKKVIPGINDLAASDPDLASTWSQKNTRSVETVSSGSDYVATWDCIDCGFTWKCRVYLRAGRVCPICAGRELGEGFNDLYTKAPWLREEWSPSNISPMTKVKYNSSEKADWICKSDKNHKWSSIIRDRFHGSGCPHCVPKVSKQETEVFLYIKSLLPGEEVIQSYKYSPRREFDIYIPSRGIAIEYNGLLWHSEMYNATHVGDKVLDGMNIGVDLYVIWQDDWLMRKSIVKRWIRNLLGVTDEHRIGARTCQVETLSSVDAYSFLDRWHIQGRSYGSIKIGLKHKNNLVAVMVLRKAPNGVLSLVRYATSALIPGGFTRLLSWVDRNVDYTKMETFADLCSSRGRLYVGTGWTEVGVIPPDYSYTDFSVRRHKFNYRVSRFRDNPDLKFEEGLTERELATLNKLYRVYDAGKIKYEREKPND